MCGGGGDASKAASQQEAQRQAGIANAVGQINQIYGSPQRQQQYTDFADALQQRNLLALNQQHDTANRNLNFALARMGLTGGSADADAAAQEERQYNQGLLKGQQSALAAAAGLQHADQQSKQNLIGLAESGLDATSASNQALDTLQANINNAQSTANAQDIGDAFSGLGSYFANSQNAAKLRQLTVDPATNGLFSTTTPYRGAGSMYTAPWLASSNVSQFYR